MTSNKIIEITPIVDSLSINFSIFCYNYLMKDSNIYKTNIISRDEYGRPSGIVAINKPIDVTSHDLVNRIRKQLDIRKVGHAGALDVFADGVMIYLIGKATKLSDKLMHFDKEYITTIILGIATDTQDTEGEITEIKTGYLIKDIKNIKPTLNKFIGKQKQYVSVYSSVKVEGKKLRILMRDKNYEKQITYDQDNHKQLNLVQINKDSRPKSFSLKIPAKDITIHNIELLESGDLPIKKMTKLSKKLSSLTETQKFPYIKVKVNSSKGTYIRQLAEDIGSQLNMPAMLLALTRTKVGDISINDCIKITDL